jgi:lipoprotein signal peptidase
LVFWHWSHNLSDIAVFNLAYIAVAVSVGVMIVGSLLRRAPAATGADCGEVSDLAPA